MAAADLEVRPGLVIPGDELFETASRSSGPGGQHVNTSSTRVTLRWSPVDSAALDEARRRRLCERLAGRLTRAGNLVVHAQGSRSRARNREQARQRLAELVREGLRTRRARRPTRPSRSAKHRRLESKRHRASVKQRRGRVDPDA